MSRKRLNRAELAHYLNPTADLDAEDPRAHRSTKAERRAARHDTHAEPVADTSLVHLSGELPVRVASEKGVPLSVWAPSLETSAWKQLQQVAQLPFLHPKGLAIMPDVHVGHGACVGSVLPMRGALVPSSIGVDVGCGMCAVQLDLRADQLPDTLRGVRQAIEDTVPLGMAAHDEVVAPEVWAPLHTRYQGLLQRHRQVFKRQAGQQLGTLGGGNHFIEVCLDETQQVWVMLHSGSRGVGGQIGQHFIAQAVAWCDREGLHLPNRQLGYLLEGTDLFDDYCQAMLWAQDYARANRQVMLDLTLHAVARALGRRVAITGEAVQCHHNYVARERHFGEDLWITRKGAIRAGVGEWGIIPGSMGAESFIVRGKGSADSYCSCSHGAGRLMSRQAARQRFSTKDLRRQTDGVECRKDSGVIDEAPGAYKSIRDVMTQQRDLVDIVHTLKQIVCVKG
jgi:tRNA-splicing ligase RtcB (3'-phosphate/5'-hydroxy nucleic acid ligase)